MDSRRSYSALTPPLRKDPESKAEQTVNLLKENLLDRKVWYAGMIVEKKVSISWLKKELDAAATSAAPAIKESTRPADERATVKVEATSVPISTAEKKIEEAKKQDAVPAVSADVDKQVDVKRPTLWQRIVKELKHYSDGFKLLYFETKITYGLLKKVLRGETLTRRERKQVN